MRAFAELLRRRHAAGFDPWLADAAATELRGFAAGLRQDEAAVRAAMAEPWSNGPVEGQVNRLKLIKRSVYGRAKFDAGIWMACYGRTACAELRFRD